MMNIDFEDIAPYLAIALFIVAGGGWVANIVKVAGMGSDQLGMLLLRLVGIPFLPLGAVLGYVA